MERNNLRTLATFALFVGSGCAALIYEVVWFHMLSLVVGASGISLSILLASFMGGMCLGSVGYPSLMPNSRHPLRVYAVLEILIALCGILILLVLPSIGRLYWSYAGYGYGGMAFRGVFAAAILLPPTILMGATLPAIARGVQSTRAGLSRLGYAYGANTFGAVLGSLAAGFYLLRVHDVTVATGVAVLLNLAVAAGAMLLARNTERLSEPAAEIPEAGMTAEIPVSSTAVYVAIGLSGLTALGSEMIWTRLLALLYGPTVYTFSMILAVFLTGIGIGSAFGATWARKLRCPGFALAGCQLLLAAAIPFSALMILNVLPYWLATRDPLETVWQRMAIDLLRTAVALLPTTCLWGASFPLAVAAAGSKEKDAGRLVGRVYAANTVGAILGSLLAGLVGVPVFGSQSAQQILTMLAALSGVLMLVAIFVGNKSSQMWQTSGTSNRLFSNSRIAMALLILAMLSPLAMQLIPAIPAGLVGHGRRVHMWNYPVEYTFVAEGIDSDVAVSISPDGARAFHVSGKVVASSTAIDMRIERLLGHVPAMLHAGPRNVLVIGCGAGVTAGSLTLHPTVERIVICDIEARVPEAARANFGAENYNVLLDPRTEVVVDDARHFLAATKEKFDLITADPIHPWVRGAAALYTTEFFEMCKAHLNPDGVIAQWIPLYESNEEAVKCELATLLKVFPNATVWNSDLKNVGYDLTVVATLDEQPINVVRLQRHYISNPELRQSLAEVGMTNVTQLAKRFTAYGPRLADWLKDAEINRDCNLRLQYLAGLSLDNQSEGEIFSKLVSAAQPKEAPQPPPLAN